MSDAALEVRNVFKKFRRGEIYDSLRDLIPVMTGRMFRPRKDGELEQREFWALKDVSFEVARVKPSASSGTTVPARAPCSRC